jgi:hypothetical protein
MVTNDLLELAAISLSNLQVFDNPALLKMWCEPTAATIFPGPKIGHLKPGYEGKLSSAERRS